MFFGNNMRTRSAPIHRVNGSVRRAKVEDHRKKGFKPGRRDRLEIVSAIIAVTQQPSNLSHVAGRANLNYSTLKEYLRFMIDSRLIEKHDVARRIPVYQAMEKGNRFLELYCEGLILLHGERFLDDNSNLAEAYLLQYSRKNKLPSGSKQESLNTLPIESTQHASTKPQRAK